MLKRAYGFQTGKNWKCCQKRRERLLSSDINLIEKIYWLLEDGKRYGTLPFAGLARAGFVAVQMLQSFVNIGLLSQEEAERFYSSLRTVSKELTFDKQSLSKTDFFENMAIYDRAHMRLLRPAMMMIQTHILIGPRQLNWNKVSHLC